MSKTNSLKKDVLKISYTIVASVFMCTLGFLTGLAAEHFSRDVLGFVCTFACAGFSFIGAGLLLISAGLGYELICDHII